VREGREEPVGGRSDWNANRLEVLVCCRVVAMTATRDNFDRAHGIRDHRGFFVPAAVREPELPLGRAVVVPGARHRMYPSSSMTSQGVGFDSAFDATFEAMVRLAGVPGIGIGGGDEEDGRVMIGHPRFRDLTRRRV
jgi:hypothetical protein